MEGRGGGVSFIEIEFEGEPYGETSNSQQTSRMNSKESWMDATPRHLLLYIHTDACRKKY